MATAGRPRGLNVNPAAVDDFLAKACLSKTELCEAADISPGHFADMMRRGKGASPSLIRKMATALQCQPESIAPELSKRFISVRSDAELVAAAVEVA